MLYEPLLRMMRVDGTGITLWSESDSLSSLIRHHDSKLVHSLRVWRTRTRDFMTPTATEPRIPRRGHSKSSPSYQHNMTLPKV
ncbi:hypothetical protein MAPG_09197 [Magnaporthiopsis poae ATCC 64411]|uniref:Uncharacterized protein n=1 Tax=Magnaporthiopsis poae (strain ATCC 64411 / 73-15) TaxID=644358 RepID=A0A0C4E9B7_MAGP6|nr:hypothetical protein MAPG_09197 [Magnaporthiopsis poae ATCC 64411]